MKAIRDPGKLKKVLQRERRKGRSVGFVPTLGALHEGHLSLVRASNRENDLTVVSIFVNPTQFGPKEDFKKYPRVLNRDKRMLAKEKADFLFCPSVKKIYPEGLGKPVEIKNAKWPCLAKGLCGKFRPGHFHGVVTVVTKLLDIVRPDRLYFGAKDYQQAVVVTQLVKDLGMAVKVRVMPTVRERDGLAMSSRNRYLSSSERSRAIGISRVLLKLRDSLKKRKTSLAALRVGAIRELKQHVDKIQYLEIVDAGTLEPLTRYRKRMVAATACFVGKTRLIDNVIIFLPQ